VTVLVDSVLVLAAVVITLGGCHLFTNGIEWLGRRMKISEGAVGSIFAALGTTMPETSIPFIAIFFGTGKDQQEIGLGAILGAPFMLSTLVLPLLAMLVLLYARIGKRLSSFKLNYAEVRTDLWFFLTGYALALLCIFLPIRSLHIGTAALLVGLYLYYMRLKLSASDDETEESSLDPLLFARAVATPSYVMIAVQGAVGLGGLILGAHLFVTAAESVSKELGVAPLVLALFIAPLATELPEMSNSFLWLYRKKDRLAVGNVTGAMVFQGTVPVTFGLLGTEWVLAPSGVLTMQLAILGAAGCIVQILWGGHWRPWLLSGGALLYLGYSLRLYLFGP
jgi:cation:H+ antiporter